MTNPDHAPKSRRPRVVPGWFTLLLLALPVGMCVFAQMTDGFGDNGVNNVVSYAAVPLFGLIYGVWFTLASRQPMKRRIVAIVASVALVAALASSVRIVSWSGAMLPELGWSWQVREQLELETTALAPADAVDLATTTPEDFPGFLGPDRNGRVRAPELARDWSQRPPEQLWKVPVGEGWSGFAVVNGVAVTQEQRGDEQVVVARSVATGEELWRHAHPGKFELVLAGNGPRATPLIHEGLVYAHDVIGRLVCLEGSDGTLVWQHDLKAEYAMSDELEETTVAFGRSPSPLVYGDLVIIPAGGDPTQRQVGLVAFDRMTGELRWESPPRHFSHASPSVATVAGVERILVTNEASLSGHDPADGRLLWEHPWPGATSAEANNSQPTVVGEDRVLMSKGYGRGSTMIRLAAAQDGTLTTEEVWASRRALRTKFTNPVVHEGHGYALSDGILECVSLEDGGRVWREGRHGHGQLLLLEQESGALLLVLSEQGELLLAEASPAGEGEVLASIEALDGKTWNTIALYGDLVLIRNAYEAACYRLPTVVE